MKLPFYIINRIPPPTEGEKGVTLQCSAINGGIPPQQEVLVTIANSTAVIRKVSHLVDEKYLVTIRGCIRNRIKTGGALIPAKWSPFFGHEALCIQSERDLPRGKFQIIPPEPLRDLYPEAPLEARINGRPGFPLCLLETRFPIPFIPLLPWHILENGEKSGGILYCVDPPPERSFNSREREIFSGLFKDHISDRNLFLLRLKIHQALFAPPELQNCAYKGFTAHRDLRIQEQLAEKLKTMIAKRASGQGGARIKDLLEAAEVPEPVVRIFLDEMAALNQIRITEGWVLPQEGDPMDRLSPTGREVLKKIGEKGLAGTRHVLVKDPVLLKNIEELNRMGLIFTDGDVILSCSARDELADKIRQAREKDPEMSPSDMATQFKAQRKVIFSVIKNMEASES